MQPVIKGKTGKPLKLFQDKKGYWRVALYAGGVKQKKVFVHRWVWAQHNGPIPDGLTVDHINNDKEDNRIENLQLLSREENTIKGHAKNWVVANPEGDIFEVYNLSEFCRNNNLCLQALANKKHQYKGWRAYYA